MATQVKPVRSSDCPSDEPPAERRYFARQPILDARRRVYAYELLFRSGPEVVFRGDGDHATRTMLDTTVLYGVEELTGGPPAFVNCTMDALTERLVDVLLPGSTVLEILETLEPTPGLIATCRNLKTLGFRIALDDFDWKQGIEPLVEIADYIKFDFLQHDRTARQALLDRLSRYSHTLLAEKIETQGEYEAASAEGFTLFQGYYFCRPALLEARQIPGNKIMQLEILREVHKDPMDLHKVSQLVRRDAAITYRLLRLVNSPACAIRQEVRSVELAMIAIGEQAFRRIATLSIASALNSDQPAEILLMALARARFCELAAGRCRLDPTEQYLLGLLSLLPAMLRVPMQDALSALPLRREIREALTGVHNKERSLLDWIEAAECGDWPRCDAVAQSKTLHEKELQHCAAEARIWADRTLRSAQ